MQFQMSLDDLMLISDNRIQLSALDPEANLNETTFSELNGVPKCQLNDPKLEKKVTFARLMNKVSAEISSGSEVDAEIVILIHPFNNHTKTSISSFSLLFCSIWPSRCRVHIH